MWLCRIDNVYIKRKSLLQRIATVPFKATPLVWNAVTPAFLSLPEAALESSFLQVTVAAASVS